MDFSAKQLIGLIIVIIVGGALLAYTTATGGFNDKMEENIDTELESIQGESTGSLLVFEPRSL